MIGTGKVSDLKERDFLKFGGIAAGKLHPGIEALTIIAESPGGAMKGEFGSRDRGRRAVARL